MGKIASFLAGLFVLGASQAVTQLKNFTPDIEGAPVDYAILIDYASVGLFYLGAAIVGYTALTGVLAIIMHNYRKRKRIARQEEEERRRRERLQEQGYAPQPQPQNGQYPQNQGGPQQQQYYEDDQRQY